MRPGTILGCAEAMIDMLMDHGTLGRDYPLLDSQQLLRDIEAGLSLLQHPNDMAEMTFGTLQALYGLGINGMVMIV